MLDHQSFDVILLDLNLLDMAGVASVAALHAEAPHTPVIVLSGTPDEQMRHEALMCGACHYLVKGRESAFSLRFMIRRVLDQTER
jgi:DNA-binding response OmpR family regulator